MKVKVKKVYGEIEYDWRDILDLIRKDMEEKFGCIEIDSHDFYAEPKKDPEYILEISYRAKARGDFNEDSMWFRNKQ